MGGAPRLSNEVVVTPKKDGLSVAVFALLLASYAYFYQGGGWNENSRFDLVRAIVEDHSLAIDRFQVNTEDKALFGGHYYSDKAPGLSFLAVPLYAVLRLFQSFFSSEHHFVVFATYVVTVLTTGLATALTGLLVYRAGRKLGAGAQGAVIAALGYGLGTIAFPFATMFFGHQLAALVLFLAFYLAWEAEIAPSSWRSLSIVLLCASAPVVEFPTAPVAVLILAFHFWSSLEKQKVLAFGVLAIVPALILGFYLTRTFGGPFAVGYSSLANPGARQEMLTRGLFGLTYPKPAVLVELLIGRSRGMLPYSPVLMLGIPGYFRLLSTGEHRRPMRVLGLVVVYFLLFVSSYEWWQGGAAFGSRHLAPMLPFLATPVAVVADQRPRLSAVLAAVSVLVMLVVTSVQPKPNEQLTDPFWEFTLPSFVRGELSVGKSCPVTGFRPPGHVSFVRHARYDAFNFGMALGGSGKRTLLPLFALWLSSVWGLSISIRERSSQ